MRLCLVERLGIGNGSLPALAVVLNAPPCRKDGLGDPPAKDSLRVKAEDFRKLLDPPGLDAGKLVRGWELGERVAQQRAHLVGRLARHALWVDRKPGLAFGGQNIEVVQVAMQQHWLGGRGQQLVEEALGQVDEV